MNETASTTALNTDEKKRMLEAMCLNINASYHKLVAERFTLEQNPGNFVAIAVYRKHLADHSDRISELIEMFQTFVVTSETSPTGHLKFPELINVKQTLIRYGRGV